jgi:hypothetical protein
VVLISRHIVDNSQVTCEFLAVRTPCGRKMFTTHIHTFLTLSTECFAVASTEVCYETNS